MWCEETLELKFTLMRKRLVIRVNMRELMGVRVRSVLLHMAAW